MEPRRAQEDHGHAVVTATEDGATPSGGVSGEFLNDTPGWSVAQAGDWGDLWDVVTEWWDSTRGNSTGADYYYINQSARSVSAVATPLIQTVTGNPLERRMRAIVDCTSASRTGDFYQNGLRHSMTRPFGARFIFGPESVPADSRLWLGFSTVAGTRPDLTADLSAGSTSGCVGIVKDSADTTWHWAHSATTTVTKVDTGITVADGDLLCLDMTVVDGTIEMRLRTLGGASDESYVVDTNFPDSVTNGTGGAPLTMAYAWRAYHVAGSGTTKIALSSIRINTLYYSPW